MSHGPTEAAYSLGVRAGPTLRLVVIPQALRPKVYTPHPVMSAEEIRSRTQGVWDRFYSFGNIWRRSRCVKSLKARLASMSTERVEIPIIIGGEEFRFHADPCSREELRGA